MSNPLHYPKLRWPLDVRIERIEEDQVVIMSCPLGISDQPLVLLAEAAPVLSCFQGTMSVEEIAARFASQGIERAHLDDLIRLLDDHLFMSSPRFFAAKKQPVEPSIPMAQNRVRYCKRLWCVDHVLHLFLKN